MATQPVPQLSDVLKIPKQPGSLASVLKNGQKEVPNVSLPKTSAPVYQPTPAEQVAQKSYPGGIVPQTKPVVTAPVQTVQPFTVGDFVKSFKETPSSVVKVGSAIANTFIPAISEWTKNTVGIFSEGIALMASPTFRDQVEKGNLDLVPVLSHTDLKSYAKDTAGAMLEATIYKVIPPTVKMSLKARFGVGALQGTGFAISEGLAKDKSPEEIVKNMGQYALFGGAAEMVAPYVLRLLSTDIKNIVPSAGKLTKELTQELEKSGVSAGMSIKDVSKDYYWFDQQGKKFVQAEKPRKANVGEGVDAFVQKTPNGKGWQVVESRSGMLLGGNASKTMKAAIEEASAKVSAAKSAGTNMDELISKAVKAQGESPKYAAISGKTKEELLAELEASHKPTAGGVDIKQELPIMDADEATYLRAQGEALGGDFDKKGFKALGQQTKDAYQGWVNQRNAAKVTGFFKKAEFKNLDDLGEKGFAEFQAGSKEPKFAPLKTYFDDKFKQLTDAGVNMEHADNYLPQIWKNTNEEVQAAMGKKITQRPSFTFEKVFESYQEGIKAGLTPKFTKLSELAGWYEYYANKTIADKKFMDYLIGNSMIAPQTPNTPIGWKMLDPQYFPIKRVKLRDGTIYQGNYYAPPELADTINNYMRPGNELIAKFANYASSIKNMVLSAGIPKTGINAHGFNILARNTLADKNPISGFMKGAYYLVRPQVASEILMSNMEKATYAVEHGLTLSTEEHLLAPVEESMLKNVTNKIRDVHRKLFEEPLFNKVIPALKVQHWNMVYDDLIKSFPEEEAARKAAEITNGIYGGINWEQFGRSRDVQNLMRSTLLAADWAETNFKEIPKGFFTRGPVGKAYRRIGQNLMLAYAGLNVTNYIMSGHLSVQNAPGHEFELELGRSPSGRKRYIRVFGTGADFARIPYDIVRGLTTKDISQIPKTVRNRLSIPLATGFSMLFNTDWAGNPIYGKDRFGNPIPFKQQVGGVASQLSELFSPQYVGAVIDWLSGRIDYEQAIIQALELPGRYSYPPKKKKKRGI